jgi:lysozyme
MRALVQLAVWVAIGMGVMALLLYRGIVRFNYPDLRTYPIQGVDVSHHQGELDWTELKGPAVQFAYIKASEGATWRDPRFTSNWKSALAAGVTPGAYHFFTLCKPGAEQARNFLAALADVTGSALPPAVDLEFGGNCEHRPREQEFTRELHSFLEQVKRVTGCTPVLYVTQDFYLPYVAGRIEGYPLWVRNIFGTPRLHEGADWLLWQYANRGRMPGVGTFIDLNVYSGSATEFHEFRCTQA